MSTLLYGPSPVALNFTGNHFLAHLQAATLRRFEQGRGYFITLAGTNDQGQNITVSHWIHPSVRLSFSYETEDEYGNAPKTIELEDDQVDALLEAMDRPFGVLWGFSAEHSHYLPFAPRGLPQPPGKPDEIPGQ